MFDEWPLRFALGGVLDRVTPRRDLWPSIRTRILGDDPQQVEILLREAMEERLDPVAAPPSLWQSVQARLPANVPEAVAPMVRDAMAERLEAVVPRRDLWLSVQLELLRPKPVPRERRMLRAFATVGAVLAVVVLGLVGPLREESPALASPAKAVSQAYDELVSLDTVRYTVDTRSSNGDRTVQQFEVDIANQVHSWRSWLQQEDPLRDSPSAEHVRIGGEQYARHRQSPYETNAPWGSWEFWSEASEWRPFEAVGGLHSRGQEAFAGFDEIRRLPDTLLQGDSMEHYVAVRTNIGNPLLIGRDTVELWVRASDRLLEKVNWLHQVRYLDRNECASLGDGYWPVSGSSDESGAAHRLCRHQQSGDLRVVEREVRQVPEGEEEFSIRWTYTFTGFNEPVTLPSPMPLGGVDTSPSPAIPFDEL